MADKQKDAGRAKRLKRTHKTPLKLQETDSEDGFMKKSQVPKTQHKPSQRPSETVSLIQQEMMKKFPGVQSAATETSKLSNNYFTVTQPSLQNYEKVAIMAPLNSQTQGVNPMNNNYVITVPSPQQMTPMLVSPIFGGSSGNQSSTVEG